MRKKPKTHDDIVAHFQKRCLERIGIVLSQRTLKTLLAEKKLILISKQSREKTQWRLRREVYNGKDMLQFDVLLTYDKRHHAFVTAWKFGTTKDVTKIQRFWYNDNVN